MKTTKMNGFGITLIVLCGCYCYMQSINPALIYENEIGLAVLSAGKGWLFR